MNKVFEKIIEKLEEEKMFYFLTIANTGDEKLDYTYEQVGNALDKAIEIVNHEVEQYNNGWIPAEEELPEKDKYILLSFSNFSIPCVGRYEEDENGGAFYVGDDDKSCVSQDIFVNAWMNLPAPYQPKGEIDE